MTLGHNQARFRGLAFGDNLPVRWGENVTGLRHLVVESNPQILAQQDGYAASPHWVRPEPVMFQLRVDKHPAASPEDFEGQIAAVESVFIRQRLEADWLEFRFYGPERAFLARTLERETSIYPGWLHRRIANVVVRLERTDPYLYGTTLRSVTVPIYQVTGGGADFPWNFPVNFAAPSGQQGVAVNAGNVKAWPRIRVHLPAATAGTVNGFEVFNVTNGDRATFVLPLSPGQTFEADMAGVQRASPGPNIHIDGSSRNAAWQHPRIPFGLDSGSNTIRLSVVGTATDATASLAWRDTYL